MRLYGVDAPETAQVCKDGAGGEYACGNPLSKARPLHVLAVASVLAGSLSAGYRPRSGSLRWRKPVSRWTLLVILFCQHVEAHDRPTVAVKELSL